MGRCLPFPDHGLHPRPSSATPKNKRCRRPKANVIDPLVVTEQYATDAVRMALLSRASPGTESFFQPGPVLRKCRAFATKKHLWKRLRFLFLNMGPERCNRGTLDGRRPKTHISPPANQSTAPHQPPTYRAATVRERYFQPSPNTTHRRPAGSSSTASNECAKEVQPRHEQFRLHRSRPKVWRFFFGTSSATGMSNSKKLRFTEKIQASMTTGETISSQAFEKRTPSPPPGNARS